MAATIISSALPFASGIGRGLLCRALNCSIYGPLEMIWGSGRSSTIDAPNFPPTPWAAWVTGQVAQRALASGGGALATGLFAYAAWEWCNRPEQETS